MQTTPCAKINLGLNIVERRPDGYHNLETIFMPIPLYDKLEIEIAGDIDNSSSACELTVEGNKIDCDAKDNIVVKAYNMIAAEHKLPRIKARLTKNIPSQAGLGGGSSDAAYMLRMLNKMFELNIDNTQLKQYASRLGADCAFFIEAQPAFATGIGSCLTKIDMGNALNNCYILIVKPDIAISTKQAYAHITPRKPTICCRDAVMQPIETWKDNLSNDFELQAFTDYPELSQIKERMYDIGAIYAQMSGSGSAMFGIFKNITDDMANIFKPFHTNMLKI